MLYAAFRRVLSLLTIIVFTHALSLHAEESRGRVVRTTGDVLVFDATGQSREVGDEEFILRNKDTIVTAEGAAAVVEFSDGVLSVLDENSRLQVEKTSWLSHLSGRIYYTFRKLLGEPRQVKTRFATLGIRGTTFIVYDDHAGQSVALQEGLLDIASPGPEFELYRQRLIDQYQSYRQQEQQQQQALRREFDDYRQQVHREFIEYGTRFSLQANHVVSFDGVRVDESIIDDEVRADFEDFESIAAELLDEFREQVHQYRDQLDDEPLRDETDFE